MAIGKELGIFDIKSTSVTLVPGKGNITTTQVNYEGKITGQFACKCFATMTLESEDGKNGTYKIYGRWFLEDGGYIDGFGEGQATSIGGPAWDVVGNAQMSNGSNLAVEGEINLADHFFIGKFFEQN